MGEMGNEMFFVIHGNAEALVGVENLQVVQSYSEGSYFGEVALLTKHPRKAWVRAVAFLVVAVLDRQRFELIAEDHPDAWRSMFWRMKQVLRIASITNDNLKKQVLENYNTLEAAFRDMDIDG